MSETTLYDSLQIAYEFLKQAEQLTSDHDYEGTGVALEKAKSYAFNNAALLDDIQLRQDSLKEVQGQYIKQLEHKAADLFNHERFDGKQARQVLQLLLDYDNQNQLAKSLWAELASKESAEREHQLVEDFRNSLEKIWLRAEELEGIGAGSRAVAEYERALVETSKQAGDHHAIIPLQHLKSLAAEKRDHAKEKWVGTPTLILAQKGHELVERYETLYQQGEVETEFFDQNGEYLGRLPIEECIDRAKKMASRFAEQKAQDYLGQARTLLSESPGAAYEKIQDALALAHPSDFARTILEQELQDKIQPAMQQRETALTQLNAALTMQDPLKAWDMVQEVEILDKFTPGLEDARQRLLPMLKQKCGQQIDTGKRFEKLEDFQIAQTHLKEAIEIARKIFAYGEAFQSLNGSAQKALEHCLELEYEIKQFELRLDNIVQLSQTNPDQAKARLAEMAIQELSESAAAKVERLRIRIDFKLDIDQLFQTLEEKMLMVDNATQLIPIEEGVRQATLDYPDEKRFQRLIERITTRRLFLRGSHLRQIPGQYLEARELLQQVVDSHGDDAVAAQQLLDEIAINQQQESDITIALQEANNALSNDDVRSAYLLLEPYRHAISHQTEQIRSIFSSAATRWRNEIDQQLETVVASGDFSLPKTDFLLQELKRCHSPRVAEWEVRALAPAYAITAKDLQVLNRWEQASQLWETAFRLVPNDPSIIEGRRNAQKHQTLVQAQITFDPAEKEQLLNDLNRIHGDDPTIKRYLAEFYYAQDRYAEAQLAISQVKFLSENSPSAATKNNTKAINNLEQLIKAAGKLEKRKLIIHSLITGQTTLNNLQEARLAYEQLLANAPEQAEKLQLWWSELIKETIRHMKTQVIKLSDTAGTVWARAELLCKILALQNDPHLQEQAERLLKLAYTQLPAEIQAVVDNPQGTGYGPAIQALPNHIARANDLYKRLINMNQVERLAPNLGLTLEKHNLDLNHILYLLELTLEKLYLAREKQREIKNQVVVAMMTADWETIEDNLHQLEQSGLGQHRSLKGLAAEVEQVKSKRTELESTISQLKAAMEREAFKKVQSYLSYLSQEDPADEIQLQANLEVVDPYTRLKIKGQQKIDKNITEKMTLLTHLKEWQASCGSPVSWPIIRSQMMDLGKRGDFGPAIELGQAVIEPGGQQQTLPQSKNWSLKQVHQYLVRPPVSLDQINSIQAQTLYDQISQKVEILTQQINECDALMQELQQKEKTFTQILQDLTPLTQQLNQSKDFISSILSPAAEVQEIKQRILSLVKQGQHLCPTYPAFMNFEERGKPSTKARGLL